MKPQLIQRRAPRRLFLRSALWTGLSLGCAGVVLSDDGPNSSLYSGRMGSFTPVRQSQTYGYTPPPSTSWYEVPLPPPKEVRVHDIITIRVDLGAPIRNFQLHLTNHYEHP